MKEYNNNIFIDDIVYIYEYKNRNDIKDFSDLKKIKVTNANPGDKIVSGNIINNQVYQIDENSGLIDKCSGIPCFKKEGILLKDNKSTFFVNFKRKDKTFVFSLEKYNSNVDLLSLYIVFKIDENVKIKFKLFEDLYFSSQENATEFLDLLSISKGEVCSDYIKIKINKEEYQYTFFELYIDNKIQKNDYQRKLFQYCCKNKNSILDVKYDFNKAFSLKHEGFELCKEKV